MVEDEQLASTGILVVAYSWSLPVTEVQLYQKLKPPGAAFTVFQTEHVPTFKCSYKQQHSYKVNNLYLCTKYRF